MPTVLGLTNDVRSPMTGQQDSSGAMVPRHQTGGQMTSQRQSPAPNGSGSADTLAGKIGTTGRLDTIFKRNQASAVSSEQNLWRLFCDISQDMIDGKQSKKSKEDDDDDNEDNDDDDNDKDESTVTEHFSFCVISLFLLITKSAEGYHVRLAGLDRHDNQR